MLITLLGGSVSRSKSRFRGRDGADVWHQDTTDRAASYYVGVCAKFRALHRGEDQGARNYELLRSGRSACADHGGIFICWEASRGGGSVGSAQRLPAQREQ